MVSDEETARSRSTPMQSWARGVFKLIFTTILFAKMTSDHVYILKIYKPKYLWHRVYSHHVCKIWSLIKKLLVIQQYCQDPNSLQMLSTYLEVQCLQCFDMVYCNTGKMKLQIKKSWFFCKYSKCNKSSWSCSPYHDF